MRTGKLWWTWRQLDFCQPSGTARDSLFQQVYLTVHNMSSEAVKDTAISGLSYNTPGNTVWGSLPNKVLLVVHDVISRVLLILPRHCTGLFADGVRLSVLNMTFGNGNPMLVHLGEIFTRGSPSWGITASFRSDEGAFLSGDGPFRELTPSQGDPPGSRMTPMCSHGV